MKQLFTAKVTEGIMYNCLGDVELNLQEGDMVVVQCDRYLDYVRIMGKVGEPIEDVEEFERQKALANKGRHVEGTQTPRILRRGTDEDAATEDANSVQAAEAFSKAKVRIAAHGLEMKLIHSHYSIDRNLLLFQFSAEGRVDFRELLRDLSTLFRCRVELRQVGVRDEAGLLGGIGICGRTFCCKAFLSNFNSINVRMAKMQGIALNPQNISGHCWRLKCCLYYEADAYKDAPACNGCKPLLQAEAVDEKELAKLEAKERSAADERIPRAALHKGQLQQREPRQQQKQQRPPRQERPDRPQRPQGQQGQQGQQRPQRPGQQQGKG